MSAIKSPILLFSLLLALLVAASGCVAIVAAGAGAGSVAYLRGELRGSVAADIGSTQRAAEQVVAAKGLIQVSAESDDLSGEIIARTADDTRVRIGLKKSGERITEVRVRVGVFGDEVLSRDLFEAIRTRAE
jgi:hypothetical protein